MPQLTNLILSGGGTTGAAHIGVIVRLREQGYLDTLKRVFAVSAGALIGLGAVLNYTEEEYLKFLYQTKFHKFLHSPPGLFSNFSLFYKRFGFYSGKYLREQVDAAILEKTGLISPTFAELFAVCPIEFHVVATNKSKKILKVFSHLATPHTKVSIAIQASMAVPFIFEFVKLAEKTPGEFVFSHHGDIFVDGGIIDNFPLHLSDIICKQQDPDHQKSSSLGLYLIENEHHINYLKNNLEPPAMRYLPFIDYVWQLLDICLTNNRENIRNPEDVNRIIFIDRENRPSYQFVVNNKTKKRLVEVGKNHIEEYLKDNDLQEKSEPAKTEMIRSKL